jgi:hypothetical protein
MTLARTVGCAGTLHPVPADANVAGYENDKTHEDHTREYTPPRPAMGGRRSLRHHGHAQRCPRKADSSHSAALRDTDERAL